MSASAAASYVRPTRLLCGRFADLFSANDEVRGVALRSLISFVRDKYANMAEVTPALLDRLVNLLRESPVEDDRAAVAEGFTILTDRHQFARRIVEVNAIPALVLNLRRRFECATHA